MNFTRKSLSETLPAPVAAQRKCSICRQALRPGDEIMERNSDPRDVFHVTCLQARRAVREAEHIVKNAPQANPYRPDSHEYWEHEEDHPSHTADDVAAYDAGRSAARERNAAALASHDFQHIGSELTPRCTRCGLSREAAQYKTVVPECSNA